MAGEAVGIRQITGDEVAATIFSGAMAVVAAGIGASEAAAAEWAVSAVAAGSEVPWVAVQWVGPG